MPKKMCADFLYSSLILTVPIMFAVYLRRVFNYMFSHYMFSRELTVIGSRIGLRYSSAAIIPDAIYRRRHSPAVKAGFHLRDWQYKNKFFYPTASNYNSTLLRASRSVGDRYLGMVEAAGSIPALSIVFSAIFGFVILLRAFILGAVAYGRCRYAA